MTRTEAEKLEVGDKVTVKGSSTTYTIEAISDLGDNIGLWLSNGACEIHKNVEKVKE